MIGSNFLSGANSRLLPYSIPFRFFACAVFFYTLFWVVLFFNGDDITSYTIGSGPILSMIHLATLGVLTMTVIGASLQLLSVATRRAFKRFWVCRLLSWIYIPGFLILSYGMFESWHEAMMVGAILTGFGLLVFFYLIIDNIRGVKGMGAIMSHCFVAMLSLLCLVVLGIILIVDMEHGFLSDHLAVAHSHFILAVFGFMSLLAMGFSYILVPMFALAPAPSEKIGRLSITCNFLSLIAVLIGINTYVVWWVYIGVFLSVIGTAFYIYNMTMVYKARMRKRLGTPFLLIRMGWLMLAFTFIWGVVGLMGYWPVLTEDRGYVIFAIFAILGWLLTFLVGILQRIIPFLSSMHAAGASGIPMLSSSMADERLLKLHAYGHILAFILIIIGVFGDWSLLIKGAASIGFISALSLLIFLFNVMKYIIKPQS